MDNCKIQNDLNFIIEITFCHHFYHFFVKRREKNKTLYASNSLRFTVTFALR